VREESRIRTVVRERPLWSSERVSWSAIFAGVVLALAIQLLLGLLGVGIGAGAFQTGAGSNPVSGLGAGSAIWLLISSIIAMYIGGWVAGRLSGALRRQTGLLHGAVVWGFTTLAALYLLTSAAGSLISGTAGALGGIASTGSQMAAQLPELSDQIRQELRERGIDLESLEARVQERQSQQAAEQESPGAGGRIATGVSKAGIMAFLGLLTGLTAAAWGGANGVPRNLLAEESAPPSERIA
jgi:hypothetical protein